MRKNEEGNVGEAVAAARLGDTQRLAKWLAAGGNPNSYDDDGWTPILAACVRGHAAAVKLLLEWDGDGVNLSLPYSRSGALAIHFAGQAGSVAVAEFLLDKRPDQLNAVWDLNGHTLFLQAVFYGHADLVEFSLKRGANTAATTVRGLGGMELAEQFQNRLLVDLIRPYDSPAGKKNAYYAALLRRIAPTQDRLVGAIEDGLQKAAEDEGAIGATLETVRKIVEVEHANVNQLGGPLQQPPLVVVVTGNNGSPENRNVAKLRFTLTQYLLNNGADPLIRERHPMAVNAIIRAAVFNHLAVLKTIARYISAVSLRIALNEQPVVNGLTALHDTVLRATTAAPDRLQGYIDQIRWLVANGARIDVEDFSGNTPRSIARSVANPELRRQLMDALGVTNS
jgi:ankyrin repeat protein